MQKKGNISNDDRTAKICETEQFSKIDYGNRSSACYFHLWLLDRRVKEPVTFPFAAYKVRVQDFTDGLSTDIYTAQVLDVIKEGEY